MPSPGSLWARGSAIIAVSLLEMPSSVPMLTVARYALRRAGEDHPDVQGRLGCTRLVMVPQPPSAKNETFQSNVDIPDNRDRCYGPRMPMHSDDDDWCGLYCAR